MSRKFYTIFILPHAQEQFRKIHISRNFIVALVICLAVVAVAGLVSPHLFLKTQAQAEYVDRLEAENRRLKQDKERYETSLAHIGEQLATFESVAGKLAKAVGLRDLPFTRAAGGGGGRLGGSRAILEDELQALDMRARTLDQSFDRLNAAWDEKARYLAVTPSLAPAQGRFSDGFGWRPDPFTGEREFHRGLDIVANVGDPVRAAADGLVTVASRMNGYGKVINLAHSAALSSRYAHLSEILVRPGARVKRGDVIGRVGSTGRSSGPHLHYEVLRGGRAVDPRKYLGESLF